MFAYVVFDPERGSFCGSYAFRPRDTDGEHWAWGHASDLATYLQSRGRDVRIVCSFRPFAADCWPLQ